MPPVAASQHSVYCALPCADLAEVVAQRRVDVRRGAGPGDHHLAEVADVEDADGLAHGGVLLDHARGVLQRHRPAAELRELRARARRAGRAAATAGSVRGRAAVSSAMCANLHRLGRRSQGAARRTGDYPASGDHLPPPGREPGEDAGRRRRRRRGPELQGRDARRRRRGRRRGVRPVAAPPAQHARLHRQGRRGRARAHRRHAGEPAARARRDGRGARRPRRPAPRRTTCRRGRGALHQQRRVGRAGPAGRRRRPGPQRDSRATSSAATRSGATSRRRPTSRPAPSPCSARSRAARR